jgi:molecular chaperone DnaK
MAKVVGINLGATNSVVAVTEGGKPTVVINVENLLAEPPSGGQSRQSKPSA